MYRLKEDHEHTIEIQKSRFICYLRKTLDEEAAKEFITSIQKLHPNATHHCYAFIIGEHNEIQRSNDDGEPGGTAGMPMLDCLMKQHMQDITAVVVRYFGGTKLGVPGLIAAYKEAAAEAIAAARILEKTVDRRVTVHFPYPAMNDVMRVVKALQPRVEAQRFDNLCTMELTIRESRAEELEERLKKAGGSIAEN